MRHALLQLAIEDISSAANKSLEQEITIYAKVTDPDGFSQAIGSEEQEQAEVKIDDNRRIRVRKTTKTGTDPVYEMTSKTACGNDNGVRSFTENTITIDEAIFEMFKSACVSYQNKTRYFFNIERMTLSDGQSDNKLDVEGFKYEVDVFKNAAGEQSTWCKIDLEINDLQKEIESTGIEVNTLNVNIGASKLPFKPSEFILMDDQTSEEDRKKVFEIYNKEFLIFNKLPGEESTESKPDQEAGEGGSAEESKEDSDEETGAEAPEKKVEIDKTIEVDSDVELSVPAE